MKVLVTGGAGFLGSHVADSLQDAGHDVTILDRMDSQWVRDGQRFIKGKLEDDAVLEKALEDQEAVYHFAAMGDLDECVINPVEAAYFNVWGTVKLAERCLKQGINRFLYGSTVYVHSRTGSFYRASKQSAESFLEVFRDQEGMELTVLRYGSLYGPRAGSNNSIRKLLEQALLNGRIEYYGTGQERREFIHVHDAARASVEALQDEHNGACLTLTGPEFYTYADLLELLREMWPTQLEIKCEPSQREAHYRMTPYHYIPRSGKKLIVNPFTDLGQGLLECLSLLKKDNYD